MTLSMDRESNKSIKMTSSHGTVKISLESLGMILKNAPPNFSLKNQDITEGAPLPSMQKSFVFVSDIGSEDDGSIVVLGKSSLDAIQTQSLASYEQIYTKSMAMDCQSIISSLTPPETQKKLSEVLQENLRLKETLEQNNLTMKKHLNALMAKQDELTRVHESHRQKFAETKNLVNVLRTENSDYKTRIEGQNKESVDQNTQTDKREEEIDKEISARSENESDTEMMKLAEKCEQQTQEIAHMHRIVASLKQQLESLYQNSINSPKLEDQRSAGYSHQDPSRQNFLESFTRYNKKLEELGNCYASQISRYTSIQECLWHCSEIISEQQHLNNAMDDTQKSLESLKRKELQEHRNCLIDEELKSICERQEMIKCQNEFQKIFTDYNSTVLEVESLRKENERLRTLEKGVHLHDERLDEAKASLRESERLLENQRQSLETETQRVVKLREEIERERIRLETEERQFVEANALLNEEMVGIREMNDILRLQLSEYESDNENIRKSESNLRDRMETERDNLLQQIQRLQDEKNELSRRQWQFVHGNPND